MKQACIEAIPVKCPKRCRIRKTDYLVLALFAFLFPAQSFSQIKFERGYFIDNAGTRTDCFIRNTDWLFTPTSFVFKMDLNSSKLEKHANDVKEFGIDHVVKYVSAKVKIDRSSDRLDDNEMSNSFDPEWQEEQVFLKVLTEGDATLYSYEQQDFIRFFYKVNSSPIEQLVYKKYKAQGETSFTYNRNYINQLFTKVNCRHIAINRVENIPYSATPLLNWFQKHNNCVNPATTGSIATAKRKWFSPKILGGIKFISYRSGKSADATESGIDYGSKTGLTYGVELEFFLPVNNNKWSVFLESSTASYKASQNNNAGSIVSIDYNTINVLAGLRYYTFLNDKTKILLDAGFVKDIKQSKIAPAFGIGLSHSRLMIEYRYFYQKKVMDSYFDESTGARFTNMFLTLKFALF